MQHLLGDPHLESLGFEQIRVDQRRLACPFAPRQPERKSDQTGRAEHKQPGHSLAALLPDQDAQDDAAHSEHREHGTATVDHPRAGIRHVPYESDAGQHNRDDDGLQQESNPPGQVCGDEAAQQGAHGGRDRRRRSDQGIDLFLGCALEVPMDKGLHGRKQERRADPADERPENDDGRQSLRERHRNGPDGIAEEPQHVRPLAADQVADLAADQDEGGRDQRLERDRGLNAAHRGVKISYH